LQRARASRIAVGVKAIQISRPGGHEQLRLVELPPPALRAGEVHVAVEAVGVNFADIAVRMGLYASAKHYVGWPITPGFEFSGTVRALGAGVTGFAVGQAVFGITRFGGYASEVSVPWAQLFARPERWSSAEAAAFPTVYLTAWYALRELCKLRPAARVLVHSAAGGVGGAATQIAVACGARVLGTVGSPQKLAAARQAGAEQVIDRSQGPWQVQARTLVPGGFDVVLDAHGAESLRHGYALLAPAGRLIIYGFHGLLTRGRARPSYARLALGYLRTPRFNPFEMTGQNRGVLAFNLSYLFERGDILAEAMTELLSWVRAGRIQPPPVRTYPLHEVGRAHAALESGDSTGKLVLLP
jgi:NADPH:quinone reductase-like Zn-dependent oxidoreductase